MNIPIIVSTLFGALLFVIFYFMNKKYKIDYLYGLFGLSFVVVISFGLIVFTELNNPFLGVGLNIVLVLASFAFLGYTLTWIVAKWVLKK